MIFNRLLIAAVLAVGVAGCQQTRVVSVAETFDAKATAAALAPGDNTIRGSAFMRKLSGGIVPAAGEVVRLVPATPYSEARIKAAYGSAKTLENRRVPNFAETPPEYASLTRTTKADKKGDFEFDRVRPGRYFVLTRVFWVERAAGGAPFAFQIYDDVTVRGSGQTVEVILSGN